MNECLAVMLMAKKFNVPICPRASGFGLCEHVQHLSLRDYIACSATLEDRIVEYVDHLHEHFVYPVQMRQGRYVPPAAPDYSTEMKPNHWPNTNSRMARRGRAVPEDGQNPGTGMFFHRVQA
ncbi:MAG: Mandelate racemase/muconate lactonizing protein [Phycisphaerales bacterium]|nr:Mandelate racemase/muconate lactonizing protein [Phycisphaerales bacterium]